MAFYYLTQDLTIYKSAGARKVKRLFKYGYKKFPKVTPQFLNDMGKITIPLIRRTFPSLILNEIVGVQPMSGPVGISFSKPYTPNKNGMVYGNYIPITIQQGARRSQRPRPMCRNTIPTTLFRKQSKIICESKHFYNILAELVMHEMGK